VVDYCEHGNKPSDSIKSGEFLVYLSGCRNLKKRFCAVENNYYTISTTHFVYFAL
jgi:hypothetical protein